MKRFLFLLFAILALSSVLLVSACGEETDDGTVEICSDGRHEFTAWKTIKVATCIENGMESRSCIVCKQYTENQEYKDSNNHNYSGYTCTLCGNSIAPFEIKFKLSEDCTYYIFESLKMTEDARTEDNSYTIPSEYEGKPVKEIASRALKDCSTLETVIIPDTIEKIGEGALMGCRKIKYLTIPFVGSDKSGTIPYFGYIFGSPEATAGLQPISQGSGENYRRYYISPVLTNVTVTGGELLDGCFENCTPIKYVKYTGNGEKLGERAFKNCESLDKFEFPITLCEFGNYAFYLCKELDYFPFTEEMNVEKIGSYCFAGVNTDYLAFPSSLYSVGEYAFADCNFIKDVIIPPNIQRLSNHMFEGCSALESVTLSEASPSNRIKSIGDYCFNGCELLNTVSIPSSVEEIREGAFYRCVSLKNINFPSSLTSIEENAFAYCSSIETVSISNGLKEITSNCFDSCTSLTTVKLPSSVENIQKNAFINCSSLVNFEINKANSFLSSESGHILSADKQRLILVAPGFNEESLTIPDGIVSIESGAFANATSIKNVIFPSSLKLIASNAFYKHPSITGIYIDASMQKIGSSAFAECPLLETVSIKGVVTIDESAFAHCKVLNSVVIDSVGSILNEAFYDCAKLTSVTLSNIDLVGEASFKECAKLSSLTIGENVSVIGTEAFAFCDGLTSVVTSQGNKSIGEFAFKGCKNLTSVVLGDGCVSIGEAAFESCIALVNVKIPNTLESMNAYAFQYCTALTNIDIALGGKFAVTRNSFVVEIDANLGERTLILVAPGALTEEITIPHNIHAIGPFVFRHAQNVKKVILPETLKTIGKEAFFDSGITEIDLTYVETIGDYALGQTKLVSVIISESVKNISRYAFQYCYDLKEIYIRSSVQSIGFAAFHNVGTEEAPIKIFLEFENEEAATTAWGSSWLNGSKNEIIYGYEFS